MRPGYCADSTAAMLPSTEATAESHNETDESCSHHLSVRGLDLSLTDGRSGPLCRGCPRRHVRQIFAYRRKHDVRQYIEDVREISGSPKVRFHIKRMVASGLHQIHEPTRDEWLALEPYLLEGDRSRYVSEALRNHLGWFDLLDDLRVFRAWLASGEDRFTNAAIWFLEPPDLHDSRSERIAELIAPHVAPTALRPSLACTYAVHSGCFVNGGRKGQRRAVEKASAEVAVGF